jgi:hypothetical protein
VTNPCAAGAAGLIKKTADKNKAAAEAPPRKDPALAQGLLFVSITAIKIAVRGIARPIRL